MKVAVIGAGAIGSTYAWFLARVGHDVVIVDVRADHVEATARDGLTAELPDRQETVKVQAATDSSTVGRVDFVLIATKSYANEDAARAAVPLLGDSTLVATVQNGLGNDRVLASVIGRQRVLPGSTTVAAMPGGPGRVVIPSSTATGRSLTSLAPPRDAPELLDRVGVIAAELSAAGLPAEARPDVDVLIWRKLAVAASMAPLSAILRFTVAETLANASAAALLRRLVEEVVAVGRACRVELELEEIWQHATAIFESVGPHYASMAVDVMAGRRTEIEAMSVEVARLGREHGVAAPVSDVLGALVLALSPAS
jgi:2-dehydropantoate 2-reductase